MFNIFELFTEGVPTINIVDVGAMWMGEGETPDPFEGLLQTGAARVTGFEPQEEECARLNRMHEGGRVYLPYAIGDGSEGTFHMCNFAQTSSLYEPNTALLDKFQNLAELTQVVKTTEIKTHRLDDLKEIVDTDFLKIDTQGGELDVLAGAENVLKDATVVQTEVEFVPMYKNQPLFGDIDQALRKHGFLLHKFPGVLGRMFKPMIANNDVNRSGSQVLWGDVVYIKDFMRLSELAPEKLVRMAVLLHEVYQSFDTAAFVLQEYDRQTNASISDKYIARLVSGG